MSASIPVTEHAPLSIRNFCIIAHIDHGKSTLADRLLEFTGTVTKREMRDQLLDQMELEREKGITIKLQPVRLNYHGYILNLIDTPGHVDFTYEVSRSLAAVEGALLIVDATQGIEAQTLANLYLALDQGLTIIPIINKIDLPSADIPGVSRDICHILGCDPGDIIPISAKTGLNIDKVLAAIIEKIPAPKVSPQENLQALIFDSTFDEYQGVIAYVRIVAGEIKAGTKILLCASQDHAIALQVGYFKPQRQICDTLHEGEIGYIVTGLKTVESVRVGDTITTVDQPGLPLPGYKQVKPVVYASFFTKEGDEYEKLREALYKLKLNDASLALEPDKSDALGFGFRCGLLGLLHLEIVKERINREYNLDVIVTNPSVAYRVNLRDGTTMMAYHPNELPDPAQIVGIEEPMMKIEIVTPSSFIGNIMKFVTESHGQYSATEYLDAARVILRYRIPLSSILVDFYDRLKSASSGYASLNYDFDGYALGDLVKMEILLSGDSVDALALMVYRKEAERIGRSLVGKLKDLLPRQMFEVKIQAAVGARIVASERIPALRKDVLAKMSGGDVTRKQKLLKKQKEGKKRMASTGKVDIPPAAFLAMLKLGR